MDNHTVNLFIEYVSRQQRVMALIARMEGMKAENEACKVLGRGPNYGEDAFFRLNKRF